MASTRLIVGRNFRSQSGNHRPGIGNARQHRKYRPGDVAKAQAQILTHCYGGLFSPAKQQAFETGQSERACRNQQRGINCMSLTEFFNACQAIPELREWGARMMGLHLTNDPSLEEELRRDMREVKTLLANARGPAQ